MGTVGSPIGGDGEVGGGETGGRSPEEVGEEGDGEKPGAAGYEGKFRGRVLGCRSHHHFVCSKIPSTGRLLSSFQNDKINKSSFDEYNSRKIIIYKRMKNITPYFPH